jgi:hypothetical protein
MDRAFYYLGLACLFTHELDAVTHAEWRLLFFLREMPGPEAESSFVSLHVPLFFLILWLSHHRDKRVRGYTRSIVAAFLGLHAVLHFINSSSPVSDFQGPLSIALIVSAGVSGIAYLLLRFRSRSRDGISA